MKIASRLLALTALIAFSGGPFAGADETERSHLSKFRIQSESEMTIQGRKTTIDADTVMHYTWKCKGDERVLVFDSTQVKVEQNERQLMNRFMSRAKLVDRTADGKSKEVKVEDADVQLKAMLEDSFGAPICKLKVDENGREIKREITAGPGAKDSLAQGMISNALLFHPPFLSNANSWTAPAKVSMGNGGYVEGKLNYTQDAKGKDGLKVKVAGTLANDSFRPPGSPLTVKNAKYVVKGEQTYDPTLREWVSGKLVFDVSFDLNAGDQAIGNAKGKMVVTLEPAKGGK